jgi:hypothetical protein
MTPEEFLQKFQVMGLNAPANFNQRFAGDQYGRFRQSPNVEDRRDEGIRAGGLGALQAEMIKRNLMNAGAPEPLPNSPLGGQLGTSDLDRAIAFQDIQASNPQEDPATAMAFQFIDNPEGEI